jgi:hypothetical protein
MHYLIVAILPTSVFRYYKGYYYGHLGLPLGQPPGTP